MRKLLIIAHTFFPEQNGVALAAFHMVNEMSSRGWQVEAFVTESNQMPDISTPHAYPVHIGGSSLQQRNENLSELIDRFSPDIIVTHGWSAIKDTCIQDLAKTKKIPLVFQPHGFMDHKIHWRKTPPFFGVASWIRRIPFLFKIPAFYRDLAAFVPLNKNMTFSCFDAWLADKVISSKVVPIPNASMKIATPENNDFRKKYGIEPTEFLILNASSFFYGKNQAFAINSLLKHKTPDHFTFLMIGPNQNDYSQKLEKMTSGDDRFKFLYGLDREEVEEAIASCDLAVMSSRYEQQPLFLIEASALGKPWISTDVGSVRELRGGIVIPLNKTRFLDAFMKLYRNPQLRKELGEQGRDFVETNLDPNVIYDKWDALFSDILSGKHVK